MAQKKKKKKKRNFPEGMKCPYCGRSVKKVTAKEMFGDKAFEPDRIIYCCSAYPICDSYVYADTFSGRPLGMLADSGLRRLRINAHRSMERVIDAGLLDKDGVYGYLEERFGFRHGKFHIAQSGPYYCTETVKAMDRLLKIGHSA